MRIRTIKPEFFTHEELFELEIESKLPIRVAFTGLWCAADREGRFKWEPRRLGVQILPYDAIDFSRVLDALTTRGFIRRYRVDDRDYGVIPSFLSHQVINNRERPSELPEPLSYMDSDACLTRESRVDHASKAEGKGMEGNGREGYKSEKISISKNSKAKAKSQDEVADYFVEIGLPRSDGEYAWDKWESIGWEVSGKKIKDWRAGARSWKTGGYWPSQKQGNSPQPERPKRKYPDNWREIGEELFGEPITVAEFDDLDYDRKGDLLRHILEMPKNSVLTTI